MFGAQLRVILRVQFFVFFFGLRHGSKFFVPIGFQSVGHQSIVWIHLHIAQLGLIRFILSALDVLFSNPVGFGDPRLNFGLHMERHLQSQGADALQQNVANGLVHSSARDSLADRSALSNGSPLADVERLGPAVLRLVTQDHGTTTLAA